ncbi:GNAT family N-acetyltransferase [Solicola sp. PLA-1-18]|uniref:GNAT family N-acetyltransferase n=1 Tax=Solicola sp. PLA-1-18 TaxID=3380532 RepID=UPI003B79126F
MPAEVTVREATRADAPAMATLRRHWRHERRGIPMDADEGFPLRFAAWLDDQLGRGSRAWVASRDDRCVGMLLMFVHERMPEPGLDAGRWGYVGNVFVLPAHRDVGTGRRLLDAALAHADERGFARVVLNPSERSVSLYERAGFTSDHPLLVREG